MNWLDIVLLAVLAFSAWRGLAQGFSRSALGLVVVGLALYVALNYHRPVSGYLDREFGLGIKLEGIIAGLLRRRPEVPQSVPGYEPVTDLSPAPDVFPGLLDQFLAGQLEGLAMQVVQLAVVPFALSAAAFLTVFVLTVAVGRRLLSSMSHLPILGPIDRAGGFCFGLARGFVYGLMVAVMVKIMSFSSVFKEAELLTATLNGSQFATAYFGFMQYLLALFLPV